MLREIAKSVISKLSVHSNRSLTVAKSTLLLSRKVNSKKSIAGRWKFENFSPVGVSDPEKLLAVAKPYGSLPSKSVDRLLVSKPTLSDKQAIRLVQSMHACGDRDGLRSLNKILFGGGRKWIDQKDNIVVNEGLDHLLDVTLSGGTQDTSWFVFLLAASPSPLATWTATEIAANDFVNYDEATLPAFTDGGVSGQSLDNSASPATFTISTNGSSIGGGGLIGTNAKATPAGTVYNAVAFTGGNKAADDNDTLDVTVTLSAADDGA